ncbi:isoprenylcysteine carboxylmethyltransferase family protein [Agromyces sp. Marseille-P2726]|uniref:methyltransferase family protein n=1 Tax=Agromyces sp. Marseille-P2726 TaxID=2709132 RepID=UPI001570D6A7|nr:isoprenylcysteine carboxylmethyltransferase family protein [Agromyces sp. Marseille-P2726]
MTRFLRNVPVPPGQAVGVVLVLALQRLAPVTLPGSVWVHRVVGALTGMAGVACAVWATAERRRLTEGDYDMEQPTSLVATGPYGLSRHPMYVGWWCIHLGIGLARGSAWVAVTFPAAVMAEHPGVLAEERELGRAFPEFADYRRRVPRYLGLPTAGSTSARPRPLARRPRAS